MTEPLYSIGTWDTDEQAYLPHPGELAFNLTRKQLVQVMRNLQRQNYTCHRFRERDETGEFGKYAASGGKTGAAQNRGDTSRLFMPTLLNGFRKRFVSNQTCMGSEKSSSSAIRHT